LERRAPKGLRHAAFGSRSAQPVHHPILDDRPHFWAFAAGSLAVTSSCCSNLPIFLDGGTRNGEWRLPPGRHADGIRSCVWDGAHTSPARRRRQRRLVRGRRAGPPAPARIKRPEDARWAAPPAADGGCWTVALDHRRHEAGEPRLRTTRHCARRVRRLKAEFAWLPFAALCGTVAAR
jgi:hypothetical protein